MRSATVETAEYIPAEVISTHALTWSATYDLIINRRKEPIISTHALTWSATLSAPYWSFREEISTHALTWSATGLSPISSIDCFISTHALTWSATALRARPPRAAKFQLTRSRGARPSRSHVRLQLSGFQLTRSRGARQFLFGKFGRAVYNFNSRAHVERDENSRKQKIFVNYFNSRAHVERDEMLPHVPRELLYFNSRAHVERDKTKKEVNHHEQNFNSRAHVERDPIMQAKRAEYIAISTHALTWSATRERPNRS